MMEMSNSDTENQRFEEQNKETSKAEGISTKPPGINGGNTTDSSTKLTSEQKKIKWSILKNVVCVSFSFALLFTSFNSLSNLQSSLYTDMGTSSLGVIYAGFVISCFFLPSLAIKTLRPKWGICLSMFLYSPYFAAIYYPSYYTFIPTALLLGLAAAVLWSSKGTYISKIGEKYAEVVGEDFSVVIVRFFGIFFFFFQSSQVWGNLISSAVLSVGVNNFTRSEEFLEKCGANFCPDFKLGLEISSSNTSMAEQNETSFPPEEALDHQFKIYLMTTIYLAIALTSVAFIALFVTPLSSYAIDQDPPKTSNMDLLFATFKQMRKPCQLLITPLTLWLGLGQGFLMADYSAAFVSCGIGIHMVGYCFLCFGVSATICNLAFTPLIQYVNRVIIFTFAALLNFVLLIVMFVWRPNPEDYFVFFLIPALWGMNDAFWQIQLNAYYGVLFPSESEASFSNFNLWKAAGYILAFIMSSSICMKANICVQLLSLTLGMAGFYAIEVLKMGKKIN